MPGDQEPKPIKHPCILAVEGTHEEHFFSALLKCADMEHLRPLDVRAMGGRDYLPRTLAALASHPRLLDLYDEGESISLGVVRDADGNASAAFQSVCSALGNNGFPYPRGSRVVEKGDLVREGVSVIKDMAVTVFIMPGDGRTGALEDLCIQAVQDEPAYACVEAFFDCIAGIAGDAPPLPEPHKMGKARAHAYLSTKPDPDKHVGLAAKEDYWPLGSQVFDELKAFLRQVAEHA